jgi:hypothetical protein
MKCHQTVSIVFNVGSFFYPVNPVHHVRLQPLARGEGIEKRARARTLSKTAKRVLLLPLSVASRR